MIGLREWKYDSEMKRYLACSLIMRLARSKLILYAFCVFEIWNFILSSCVFPPPKKPNNKQTGDPYLPSWRMERVWHYKMAVLWVKFYFPPSSFTLFTNIRNKQKSIGLPSFYSESVLFVNPKEMRFSGSLKKSLHIGWYSHPLIVFTYTLGDTDCHLLIVWSYCKL